MKGMGKIDKTSLKASEQAAVNPVFAVRGDVLAVNPSYMFKQGRKSVSSPSAQITRPCDLTSQGNSEIISRYFSLLESLGSIPLERAIVRLLFSEGLRISEVLNIKPSDISNDGTIIIKGLKGSCNRYVRVKEDIKVWLMVKRNSTILANDYNRWYFYRLFKKFGIQVKFDGNSNNSVTHVARHLRALELQSISDDIEDVSKELGHRNISSTEYYLKNGKVL